MIIVISLQDTHNINAKKKGLSVFSAKLGKGSVNLALSTLSKRHSCAHTLHILRHCTNIVY